MKWAIPAKTFLLGEYAALENAPALLISTTPCFELALSAAQTQATIHPQSPAGLWWNQQAVKNYQLLFTDPYDHCGGLGASSAQFIGAYLAGTYLDKKEAKLDSLLEAYYHYAWNGQGLKPSGYDVIAQTQYGCVFINKKENQIKSYDWNFQDLSFVLIHTGIKLATHQHLQNTILSLPIEELSSTVNQAQAALEQNNSQLFIDSINNYHHQLMKLNLVAQHSLELIHDLADYPEVLAIKGCGAMGSDILLIITLKSQASSLYSKLKKLGKKILATEMNVTKKEQILININ